LLEAVAFPDSRQKKAPSSFPDRALQKEAGIVLLSHTVTRAIPSPQEGLTAEFGMGSGVAPLLKTPAKDVIYNVRTVSRTPHI